MGKNPYIDSKAPPPPKRAYTVTVRNTGQKLRVDPADLPSGYDGQPGSLLRTLLHAGVAIDHSCGGVVACSTCHIYVEKGLDTAPEPIEEEEDMLDLAFGLTRTSRLGCQIVITEKLDGLVVRLPESTRNLLLEE